MKKYIVLLIIMISLPFSANAQTRGVKIGYIDMEYILEKVPDYAEAKVQLEAKAQKWKQEMEVKKTEISKLREGLKTEKVLLTKELIAEREEEIAFLETELLDYQQKKFGPSGDLIIQKAVLVKPVQDQVFNAVQDLAEAKKYDYIFDKSSDLTMLFAAKRFDVSDQVVRVLERGEKRQQRSKKQLKDEAEKERKQDMVDDNPALADRKKVLDDKKAERQRLLDERKLAAEEKKKAQDDARKELLASKGSKKTGTVSDNNVTNPDATADDKAIELKLLKEQKLADADALKKKTLEDRQKVLEDRKKALEEKKAKILADREAAKKEKEDNKNKPK
ncbi:MAG: OmpH family outer membrane protein [Flavobacterium sp.]|nr:OmpH family outer membrane protein [Flavobacterium sp.]